MVAPRKEEQSWLSLRAGRRCRPCFMTWTRRRRRCGLSRSVLYELIRSGRLRTVKQGRRRLVPVSALAEYVDSLGRRT